MNRRPALEVMSTLSFIPTVFGDIDNNAISI